MSSALSEHEYEPIANPLNPGLLASRGHSPATAATAAPVVRITDTDVVPVGDSDESIDIQERRYPPKLILDGDVVLPLDGQIEDSVMQGRELGETIDQESEDQETAQQLQDRLEERFLNAATPCTESRTDAEINTSQVDSSALEELPLRRGARGFPQRLRSHAGKLRSRLRGIQRPTFSLPDRQKAEKSVKSAKIEKVKPLRIEKAKTVKTEKPKSDKPRFSFPDRPKFSLPERPKFNFPERPKFNFPERPKFSFPDRAKFSMPDRPKFNLPEKAKFNLKRPSINLPTLGRVKRPAKERQDSTESTSGSKRNIFDFATYPRLFDKKSKSRGEYATSSPKASRAQVPDSSTVPRVKKKQQSVGARWVERFSDIIYADDDQDSAVERSKPWRHPSLEKPRVSLREDSENAPDRLPWEESEERSMDRSRDESPEKFDGEEPRDEVRLGDEARLGVEYEQESMEVERPEIPVVKAARTPDKPVRLRDVRDQQQRSNVNSHAKGTTSDDTAEDLHPDFEEDVVPEDPGPYEPELVRDSVVKIIGHRSKPGWRQESSEVEDVEDHRVLEEDPAPDSYDQEYSGEMIGVDEYGRSFMPIDPRKYMANREATPEETSIRSDREQRSSGSSSDRRRRGVLEEIDSDEFFLRAKGISQDEMNVGRCLATEIRDAFRPTANALADQELDDVPPTRPTRTRSFKRGAKDSDSHKNVSPPTRPNRERRRSEDSQAEDMESYLAEKSPSINDTPHRIIYQTEQIPQAVETPDDVMVVKPVRRKSRSVARSYSELGSQISIPPPPPTPPIAPRRRKRGRRNDEMDMELAGAGVRRALCNGHGQVNNQHHVGEHIHGHVRAHLREPEHEDVSEDIMHEHDRGQRAWSEGIIFLPESGIDRGVVSESIMKREESHAFRDHRLDHEYIEPAPIAPKRRSRSRGTSVVDDDRTSRGAESLPEVSLVEEDVVARDTDSRDFPGYAIVEKRDKPPRPPPPRRRRDKFTTSPRPTAPVVPVRPQRAYSTLGPSRTRSVSETRSENQMDVTPYVEIDSDDGECQEARNEDVVDKIQGRPLPAPPRPPRARRDAADPNLVSESVVEVAVSTQTDPLPDDVVIEEEVTRAKLVMAPSRSGSQIMVSTERISSPVFGASAPNSGPPSPTFDAPTLTIPSLPQAQRDRRIAPSSSEADPPGLEGVPETNSRDGVADPAVLRLASISPTEDRIRVSSLEVADLRVERLNVGQLEANKISASEIDAVVVSASEMLNASNPQDSEIHPSLLRELIAIRSHLEQVVSSRQVNEAPVSRQTEEPLNVVEQLIESLKRSDAEESVREEGNKKTTQQLTQQLPETTTTVNEVDGKIREEPEMVRATSIAKKPEVKDEQTDVQSTIEDSEVPASFSKLANPELTPSLVEPIVEDSKIPQSFAKLADPKPEALTVPSTKDDDEISRPFSKVSEQRLESSLTSVLEKSVSPVTSDLAASQHVTEDGQESTNRRTTTRDEQDERRKTKSSRSRSPSPTIDGKRPVRQTASPVRSLPPVISVTPDSPDPVPCRVTESEIQPQRAVVSYSNEDEEEPRSHRFESSTDGSTRYVAFPTSQIPASFFSLASPSSSCLDSEPSITDSAQELLRALRVAGTRAMRHFVGFVSARVNPEERGEKLKEVELALCALLLLVAGLLILFLGTPHTVTHYHHWDYFNPPQ